MAIVCLLCRCGLFRRYSIRWHIKRSFDLIIRIRRRAVIAPQPAHHLGQHGATLFGTMQSDAPRVVDVVALFRHRLHQAYVLVEPIPLFVVLSAPSLAPVVVTAILKKDANRLPLGLTHNVGVRMTSANIGKATYNTQYFEKLVELLPDNRKSINST